MVVVSQSNANNYGRHSNPFPACHTRMHICALDYTFCPYPHAPILPKNILAFSRIPSPLKLSTPAWILRNPLHVSGSQ